MDDIIDENEEVVDEVPEPDWFIDLDWYKSNNRSFSILAGRCLCVKCRKRLKVEEAEPPADKLLSAIRGCCSHEPGFITGELPVMESVFRLFLSNGNQPLALEEISGQLGERHGANLYRTPVEVLSRLLDSDRYYGIKPVD
ncbi:hypothetical protein ACFLW0_02415 [Chloroflexota bacterium]